MIQRIQTIWLLLAALAAFALFYTDVYRAEFAAGGSMPVLKHLRVAEHYPSLLVAVVVVLIPLAAIFLFKNRKRQRSLAWGGVLATLGFISVNLMRIGNFNNQIPQPVNGAYQAGSVLPVVVLIFLILAIRGINRDEKLVRSLDRLR